MASPSSQVQCSAAAARAQVHRIARKQELVHDVSMAAARGDMARREPIDVRPGDVAAGDHQLGHDWQVASVGGMVQRYRAVRHA